MAKKALSRRQFFRMGPRALVEGVRERGDAEEEQRCPQRPPGAIAADDVFVQTCEKCHACADACPHDVIKIVTGPEHGQLEGTPFLDLLRDPCRWCKTMDCVQACPSSALQFNGDRPEDCAADELFRYVPALTTATLNDALCLNSQGTICDECMIFCPTHVRAISFAQRRPTLNADDCVGCGLCVKYCASTSVAISLDE